MASHLSAADAQPSIAGDAQPSIAAGAPPSVAADAPLSVAASAVRALVAWGLILLLAIVNGVLREAVLVPILGSAPGLMLSGVILAGCVLAVAVGLVARLAPMSALRCAVIGAFWLVLTVAFEFGFGLAVARKSWGKLLRAYTFEGGNLWPFVLLVVLFAPLAAAWFLRRRAARAAAVP